MFVSINDSGGPLHGIDRLLYAWKRVVRKGDARWMHYFGQVLMLFMWGGRVGEIFLNKTTKAKTTPLRFGDLLRYRKYSRLEDGGFLAGGLYSQKVDKRDPLVLLPLIRGSFDPLYFGIMRPHGIKHVLDIYDPALMWTNLATEQCPAARV